MMSLSPEPVYPVALQAIYEEVQSARSFTVDDGLRQRWKEHCAKVQAVVPHVQLEDEGAVLYTGELSPGCATCKAGTWDCVFTTARCNINCVFCINPHSIPADYTGSGFGSHAEEITANYQRTQIDGVSFSGGDPFVNPDKLFAWISHFKREHPQAYYWLYTNGLLAQETYLQRLGELGIDEIRFNMAATGYQHPRVMQNLEIAGRYIPNLSVEIPAIPEHEKRLLASLEAWCNIGVRFLNLHELMYEVGTNAAQMPGQRLHVTLPDGHHTLINPYSRDLVLKVMSYVHDQHLPLNVNDCSLQSKLRQLQGRRRSLAPITQQTYEILSNDGLFLTHCTYTPEELFVFHPRDTAIMHSRYPNYPFLRLARTAPLSINEISRWVIIESLEV